MEQMISQLLEPRFCIRPRTPYYLKHGTRNKMSVFQSPSLQLTNTSKVYIVSTTDPGNPKELTSGKQGATRSPVLNSDATKAAWLELAEDGYEADKYDFPLTILNLAHFFLRANIVVYDLVKGVRFTLIEKWDRSPDSLAVCALYIIA